LTVEPKNGRNRRRFDLVTADPSSEAQRRVSLGATFLSDLTDGVELADPGSNEFGLHAEGESTDPLNTLACRRSLTETFKRLGWLRSERCEHALAQLPSRPKPGVEEPSIQTAENHPIARPSGQRNVSAGIPTSANLWRTTMRATP
jgi:hypothetical protein